MLSYSRKHLSIIRPTEVPWKPYPNKRGLISLKSPKEVFSALATLQVSQEESATCAAEPMVFIMQKT